MILGLDVGDRRVGVAASDGSGLLARPVFTLHRTSSGREDVRSVARLARKHGAVAVVVGLPLHMSGDESPQAAKTRQFAEALAAKAGLPVHFWDERLSSHAAEEILRAQGAEPEERKARLDEVSAAVILQGFLDARRAESGGNADAQARVDERL